MSSDDASDDSGFDKEAERERLREKYEAEEKDRENTRRMSELLLQGATMTGKHCDECGDPIFRYDGQEFCPTCQHAVQQAQQAEQGQQGQQGQQAQQGQQRPEQGQQPRQNQQPGQGQTRPDDAEATPEEDAVDADQAVETGQADAGADHGTPGGADADQSGDEPRVEINDVRVADRHADRSNLRQPPSRQGRRGRDRRSANHQRARGGRRATDHQHDRGAGRQGAGDATPGDLATARESLVRTLTDLARRAEETEDAARARDLLATAREAAEALAALDRANR